MAGKRVKNVLWYFWLTGLFFIFLFLGLLYLDNPTREISLDMAKGHVRTIVCWQDFENPPEFELVHANFVGQIHPQVFIEIHTSAETIEQFKHTMKTLLRGPEATTTSRPASDFKEGPLNSLQSFELPRSNLPWWKPEDLPDAEVILLNNPGGYSMIASRKTGRVFLHRSSG